MLWGVFGVVVGMLFMQSVWCLRGVLLCERRGRGNGEELRSSCEGDDV